ncbi:uncharacterized protein G2W53_027426 [Senna tora]|uniref:Retrotransposon Copia-like N-terminal domain-containing protein n=1 Tax=Senna tora TaxID=362788 RepID=A0A834TIY1_9FABA|nr:uncharacterized protein G2W53_027426 [Senna tora]
MDPNNEKSREDREQGRQEDQEDRPRKNGHERRSQEGHREEDKPKKNGERPWALLNSDQPGMSLVVSQLTSTNFLGWSTAIKTALEAKGKLGFIDRSIEEPTDEEDYWKWKKADSMVKSWIVNSMTKELADFFVYCRTTRELWDELEDRFGKACGPLLYQIQREVASTEQGSNSLVTYYGKLRKWWDELDRLKPTPRCTCGGCRCGINKRLEERESSNKLLQFLMGLHQRFKTIRTQILNFDPLPTINKAFAMVSQDEVQMDVKDMFNPLEVAAAGFKKEEMGSRRFKNKEDKKDKVCSHCQMKGHTKEECFKIVGYPEWYNDLKNQRKKSSVKKVVATAAESPLDDETENSKDWASIISQIVRQEISKAREEKANVAYLGEFTDLTPMPVRAFESETLKEDNEEHSDCEAPVDPIAETQHDDLDAEVQEMPHNETDDLTDVSITDHDQNSDEKTLHELMSLQRHIGCRCSAILDVAAAPSLSLLSLSRETTWLIEESTSASPSDRANFLLNEVCYETRSPTLCVRFAKFGFSMTSRNNVGVLKIALGIAIDIAGFSANNIYRMLKNDRVRSEYEDLFKTCLHSYAEVTTTLKRTRWRIGRDPIASDYGFASALYSIGQCDRASASKDASFLPILATNQVLKRLVSFGKIFIQDHVFV